MLLQRTHSTARDALQTERLRLAEYEHTITEVGCCCFPLDRLCAAWESN